MVGYKRPEEEVPDNQVIRKFPVFHGLSKTRRESMERFLDDYQKKFLIKLNTPLDVVEEVVRRAKLKKKGQNKEWYTFRDGFHPSENYFVVDKEGTNFAIIKYGQRGTPYILEAGLRMIFTHTDSPCLIVKSKPEQFEWDPERKELYTGARLDTIAYGGIHPYQWLGRSVYLTGWTITPSKKRKKLHIGAGFIPDISPHIFANARDNATALGEAFLIENLDIVLGNESKKAMRRYFGFDTSEDWSHSRIFAVPYTNPKRLDNYYITGYGQDDRACVYAALRALFSARQKHTCVLFGFDKEEIGSHGTSGAQGRFFEEVIADLAYGEEKKYWSSENLSYRIDKILRNSIAINADVDIGSTHAEIDDVDWENVARFGYGPFVHTQDGADEDNQVSPLTVRIMRNLAERPFRNSPMKIKSQFIGSPHKADNVSGNGTMSIHFTKRGIDTIDVGIPVGSLHSPEELINGGDLYWAYLFYQAFFEMDS